MNLNLGQLPTYKDLSPVLRTQTTSVFGQEHVFGDIADVVVADYNDMIKAAKVA